MRFAQVLLRRDGIPTVIPWLIDEPEVYSVREEYDRWEGLPYAFEWDPTEWYEECECECCGAMRSRKVAP